MKYARLWKWENTWLVFSMVFFLILPWSLAVGFVPGLGDIYRGVSLRGFLLPLVFGLFWGSGMVTFGLCLKSMGIALAISVVFGLNSLFGALIPLLVLSPKDLFHPQGIMLLISMPILFLGLTLYSMAGRRREGEQRSPESAVRTGPVSFGAGLAICIFSGVFGSNFNLGFAFSGEILRKSCQLGASPVTATYAVWAPVFSASLIPNLIYCAFLLSRDGGWPLFYRAGWMRETLLSVAMAILGVAALFGYGIGATLIGKYGTSLGFALFLSASIVISNTLGVLTGEWRATSLKTKKLLTGAVAVILISVFVLSLGELFQ